LTVIGSLEDLSFPDILQVIHVSRQSGTLVLKGRDGERRVRFHEGLVCGATLGRGGPELEDLLVQKGHVDREALAAARERGARTGEPLSSALVALGAVSQETVERVVREELRSMLRSLVLLQEGEFRFKVDDAGAAGGAEIGLREGLGPETILGGVERRRAAPRLVERRAALPRVPRRVLLVIDRAVIRFALKEELLRRHFQVDACATPASAIELARSLSGRGEPFALVCDLILPDATGRGWRGGFDLLLQIRALAPGVMAIMVGEVRDAETAREARSAGAVGYLPFPDLGSGNLADVGPRLAQFCAEVRAALHHPERLAVGEPLPAPEPVRVVDQLSLLRGLIGEMHGDEETAIPLLILRLAGEYFERGVLFVVRGDEAWGTGAFGGEREPGAGGGLDSRIRGVALPLTRGSALQRAAQERGPTIGPIARTRPNAALLERLGAPAPAEAALLPLVSGRRVLGVLYGDNAPSGRPVGDLKGLEIFLSQAGIALENTSLHRHIDSLGGAGRAGDAGALGSDG
jgi:CheY-like chemotaxis protein